MDRRRAAGALLALAACIACATAAPTASNQTALDLYDSDSAEGCYYNFQHYGEGDRIMTNEPCLNCTCHNRMLMCYLRVCPFTKPIGQDCTVEKRADQCCPIVTCPDVPVDLLTSTPTTSPAEYGTTGVGRLDKYGCSINGKYFSEGSKVPPSPNKPCEHCYCIRNMTTCVMQECTLHVDGCTPIYHKEVCCPIRYSCDHEDEEIPMLDDMTTTVRPTPGFLLTTTTVASVTQIPQECVHEDKIFPDGALIKTEKACEHCYCMKGDIVCVVQECGTPMENEGKNCTSLAPREGQCCPDTYICEGDEAPTEIPTELPTEVATEVQKEAATEEPTETATEAQKETPNEPEESTESRKEYSTEKPKEGTTQISLEDVTEGQNEIITEVPEEVTTLVLTEDATDKLKEAVTETTVEETSEVQKESITEEPSVKTTEEVTEKQKEPSTEESKDETTKALTDDVTHAYSEATTELPKETVTEYITHAATFAPTEAEVESGSVTETEGSGEIATESTSKASELATQPPKDTTTEIITQPTEKTVTEPSTHAASEVAPDEPTKESTTFIPPRRTSVEGSGYRNEPDELFTESPFLEPETEGSGDEERTEKPTGVEVPLIPIEETMSSVSDFESEVTTAKDMSIYSSSKTEATVSHSEQTTTEPDKGENTVPSDDILPSIFDETHSEAPSTMQASEDTTPIIDQKTEIPLEEKIGEKPAVTTPEAFTLALTESDMTTEIQSITSEPVLEDEKVTEAPIEITTSKESAHITTDKSDASETVAPMTDKEELDIQTTVSFDEKESKSTTVQLPDTPSEAETVKPEEATTEAVQEYTTSEHKIKEQDLYTTEQPAIEAVKTTTLSSNVPETTSINPLENEIHEEGTPSLTPGVIPGEGNCLVDGITYNNDSAVPTSHKCLSNCKCVSSIVKCEEIMCSPEPQNMGICKAVYESEESCCPYYTCDQAKETPPLKAHSQMSGTELPMTQDHCAGESCNKQDEQTSPTTPTKEEDVIQPEVCSDGKCISPPKDCSGDSCQLPSRKDCAKDGTCDVSDQETCKGPNCDSTFVKDPVEPTQDNTQGCASPEDCKSSAPDITKSTCEGDECTLIKQDCSSGKCETTPVEIPMIPDVQKQEPACGGDSDCNLTVQSQEPQPECTDETCIKKDVKDVKDKPSSVCSDDSCMQQEITPSSEVGLLSTESPESIDKIQTELPAVIETDTEKQIISDLPTTVPEERTESPQLATHTNEIGLEIPEATTSGQVTTSHEIEMQEITTETPEITKPQDTSTDTPNMSEVPESQEEDKTTVSIEQQEIEQSHTESTIAELPEAYTTAKSESEITTAPAVSEEQKPEDVIHMQDTESPVETSSLETRIDTTEPTVMETSAPTKVDEETTESDLNKLTTATEKEEINTVLPEVRPTESFGEAEVTKLPEGSLVTESQKEQPIEEKPAFTEVPPESPVTESQNNFATEGDGNLDVEINKTPEDERDVTKLPEEVTETKTEQSIKDEIDTKPQVTTIETTMKPYSDEEALTTEGPKEPALEPQEPITESPVIPIMDDKDNTEAPVIDTKEVTTATPDQPPVQHKDTSTEGPEFITTEFHDVYTKTPEMPSSEEQVKHTVITVAPVTESQDSEQTVEQERITTSVYSVTEPQEAVTEKDISTTETQETESKATETLPREEQEKETEHPITTNEEDATKPPQEPVTMPQESPVTDMNEIATKVSDEQGVVTDVPVVPVPGQGHVDTAAPEAMIPEDKEKQTESPTSIVSEAETKSPEVTIEDVSTKEPALSSTEPQDSVTITPEHPEKDDEKATEYPAMLPQGTEQPDLSTEFLEVPTTESQKTDTEVPETLVPHEEENITEVPKLVTEPEEVVTETPVEQPAGEQEAPVTKHQESTEVPKISEKEPTTEVVTKSPEEEEPAITKIPEVEEPTTANVDTKQSEYEKSTKVPETDTKTPEEQDIQTENPLAPVTEQPELNISPDETQHIKHDEPESPVTETQESVTDSVEPIKEEKFTEIPETESQDTFSTTTLPLSVQDTQTDAPEKTVTDKQDTITQPPEVAQPEEVEQQTEIPDSPVTQFEDEPTKVHDAKQPDSQDITTVSLEPMQPETQAATEMYVGETTSSEPESQELVTEIPETSKPEEHQPYTNAPELVTESQEMSSTQTAEQEIPVTSVTQSDETSANVPESVKEDIEKQTMVPEFQLTEPQQIGTETPEKHDVPKEATAAPATESQEAFTNGPVTLVPEEQSTESPAVESQEPATGTPQVPSHDGSHTEPPVVQEPIVPEEPTNLGGKVTEVPERDITEPHDIITDSPMPSVTEKQDNDGSITESQETVTSVHDDKISSTDEPTTQTSHTKLEYSETTPYFVELEEHTPKIEMVTSTDVSEEVSVQATEAYEKPKEPSIEIEEPAKEPVTTEKSMDVSSGMEVSSAEPTTNAPTTLQESAITESKLQEESTPSSDVEDTRKTTIASDEIEDKGPDGVPVPIIPITEKEAVPTTQPEAETEKYTTVQTTEKPMEATSSQEVSSEEDSHPLRTTTDKSADDVTTQASIDKATTAESKPTELSSPIPQETTKPTSSEEVPSEEDAGQFPPSGTGYGQEPDYAEEDQAFGPGTCRYGGKVYVSAQQIPRDDPCDFCFCFRSDIICLQQSCPPPIHGCHEEPIQGFCCPRYECPVSMATTLNMTTTTTTTTTTLPPHFLTHAYNGAAQKRGCLIKGHTYKVGEVVRASSGPCLHCTCGGDGQMKCDPKVCTPEPMLRQMIAAAVSAKRRR